MKFLAPPQRDWFVVELRQASEEGYRRLPDWAQSVYRSKNIGGSMALTQGMTTSWAGNRHATLRLNFIDDRGATILSRELQAYEDCLAAYLRYRLLNRDLAEAKKYPGDYRRIFLWRSYGRTFEEASRHLDAYGHDDLLAQTPYSLVSKQVIAKAKISN